MSHDARHDASHEAPDPALLLKYLDDTATPMEREHVEGWVHAHAAHARELDTLRRAWALSPQPATHADVAHLWHTVDARLTQGDAATRPPSRRRVPTRWAASGAAITLGIAALGTIATIVTTSLRNHTHPAEPPRHYQTAAGKTATMRLADGSAITLAPATAVDIEGDAITIRGEVYITVAPRAARPWTVHTSNAVVQILGTKFAVRHYADDRDTRVIVEDGKVSVQSRQQARTATHERQRAVLSAAMLASVTDSGITVTSGIAPRDYLGWINGELTFREARLATVVAELSRAYGVEIRLADSALATRGVTMTASVNTDRVADVLDLMTQAVNARVQRVGTVFVIVPGRAQTRHVPRTKDSLLQNTPSETQYGR